MITKKWISLIFLMGFFAGLLHAQELSMNKEELRAIWQDCHQCLTCVEEVKKKKIDRCLLDLSERQLAGQEAICNPSMYENCNSMGSFIEHDRFTKTIREFYSEDCLDRNEPAVVSCIEERKKTTYQGAGKCDISWTEDMCADWLRNGCRNRIRMACYAKYENLQEPKYFYQVSCAQGRVETSCDKLKGQQSGRFLFWFALAMIGIAAYLISKTIFIDESQFQAAEKLEEKISKEDLAKIGIVLKYSRPFFKRYVSQIVATMKNKKKIKTRYQRGLASAGLLEFLSPEDFFSFKLFLVLGFPIMFLVLRYFLEEQWSLGMIPVVALFGYYYPDLWMSGRIKRRQKEIILAMPFCVDMLALSVEAGLDFVAAMSRVLLKAKPSALTYEFGLLIKEIAVGSSRSDALRNMAWRVNLIQVSSFSATLIAADQVGANIAPILKALSDEIRQKRSSEIEKAGATAATKILFPMMLLIVPAVFIIIAAPVILQFAAGR
jgi:tight adherence protein C